jgi:DsbC/DsbD-like thiol-disulfide interchange protein
VPHPGTFLIDRQGRVLEHYQERITGTSLLARLGVNVDAAGTARAEGKQITVRTGTSDAEAAPGKRLTLIVDVTPGPKMHVYAPQQTGYIPITLTLDESPDVRAAAPRFPPPGTYVFAPLKETVQVYDARFRVTQEVTLALSRELRQRAAARETLVIRGQLAYQACDDAVCYRPDTIPLTWRVRLVPLVR